MAELLSKEVKMKYLILIFTLFFGFTSSSYAAPFNQNSISVNYKLMDQSAFKKIIAGRTIAGVSSNSKSLYLLYFAPDGTCEMWKQNHIYTGTWWAEQDDEGKDFFRAFWPDYAHKQPEPTSAWYYFDSQQSDTLFVTTKTERYPVLLLPGKAFPHQ